MHSIARQRARPRREQPSPQLSPAYRAPCGGGRLIAPFPNRKVILLPSRDPGQGFEPILFHSSSSVGDELMSIVELNAVTRASGNISVTRPSNRNNSSW